MHKLSKSMIPQFLMTLFINSVATNPSLLIPCFVKYLLEQKGGNSVVTFNTPLFGSLGSGCPIIFDIVFKKLLNYNYINIQL